VTDQRARSGPNQQAVDELRALVAKAKSGDQSVLPDLRRFLAKRRSFWRHTAELAQRATTAQLNLICGDDHEARKAVLGRLCTLQTELSGPAPTPLERLLVDRVLACRLQALHADLMYAHASPDDQVQAKFHEQRLDRANRRLTFAAKQLAQVRRLLTNDST